MKNHQPDFQLIVQNGEDSKVEFKSANFHNDSLAKEIVAFLNTKGGDIYIGIEDDGTISGIEDNHTEERVVNICRNGILPSIIPEIFMMTYKGKRVIRLSIESGKNKPYKIKKTGKYYIRAGSTSIEPTTEELVRLFQDGERLHIEVSSIHGTTIKQLDMLSFRNYCADYRAIQLEEENIETLLYNLQITDELGNLTIVGMLFFGIEVARYLPQAGIEMNCFDGSEVTTTILDYKSEIGNIPFLIHSAVQFVKINSRVAVSFDKDEIVRQEKPDYEPFAVRESIVNAFMHRDWSIFGQKIRVNLFSDRLEIFSPGRLPNTLNLQRALAGISYYRNPVIAQLLKDYKLADKVGRGLQTILKHYRIHHLTPPAFEADQEHFKVILFNSNH